jgi:hypothetical protein
MGIGGKSILDCTTEDFIRAGYYTRGSLARNGVPNGTPCREPHVWDLAEEDRVLYLYCTKCQHTEKLDPNKRIHDNVEPTSYSFRGHGF